MQRALAAAAAEAAHYNGPPQTAPIAEHVPNAASAFPLQTSASCQSAFKAQLPSRPQIQHDWNQQDLSQTHFTCSPGNAGDMSFDFGFDQSIPQVLEGSIRIPSPTSSASYDLVSPQIWGSELATPTISASSQSQFEQPMASPGLQMGSYVGARRGPAAKTRPSNFDAFAHAAPQMSFHHQPSVSPEMSDGGIDLASRRRRPRPAALASASLRSRSYGALTSASPTFRQGMTPPAAHTLRHAKSAGHSLNSQYPGIRKPSIPHRSPLNFSTFAESEAFKELMAQKAAEEIAQQQSTPTMNTHMNYVGQQEPMARSLSQIVYSNGSCADMSQMQSPPITPFQPDFYLQTSSMMAPSIQEQYASFADYTPPYSAGPLTNSSWSDAPLTSPDLANFAHAGIMPALPYGGPADDHHNMSYMLSARQVPYIQTNTPTETRKTEFMMQEFPNQKEEHARAAKLLDHPRPKHYAFENKSQRDYSPT